MLVLGLMIPDSKPKVDLVRNGHRGWCSKGHSLSLGRSVEDTDNFQSEKGNLEAKSAAVHGEARRVFSQHPKAAW